MHAACVRRFQFFDYSPMLSGQIKYETEFDWGGTHVYVTSAEVEGLRVFFIEPKNGFFDTQTVYGRSDDEVGRVEVDRRHIWVRREQ